MRKKTTPVKAQKFLQNVSINIFFNTTKHYGLISSLDIPLPKRLPQPCTVRYLVENYWDIQGVPRRYFFELLSHLTDSELEEEKLQEFNTAEGQVITRQTVRNDSP